MSNFWGHLKTVTKHRFIVFKLCTRCGLVWRGLMHDLSKFSPTEFWESVRYYQGTRSPIKKCREVNGYSLAWLHHKGHNKHHWEYWFDFENKVQMNIPYKYAVESVCDRIAASKTYQGKNFNVANVYRYWQEKTPKFMLNDNMIAFFEKVFSDLRDHGEKYVLNKKYLKATYHDLVESVPPTQTLTPPVKPIKNTDEPAQKTEPAQK